MPDADEFLTTAEVAELLRVPTATIHRWVSQGTGPRSYRIGRHRRYRRADVDRWLDQHASEPEPAA